MAGMGNASRSIVRAHVVMSRIPKNSLKIVLTIVQAFERMSLLLKTIAPRGLYELRIRHCSNGTVVSGYGNWTGPNIRRRQIRKVVTVRPGPQTLEDMMSLNKRERNLLENAVEISAQAHATDRKEQFPDSADLRELLVRAALIFTHVESKLIKLAENTNNYEWFDAIDSFVDSLEADLSDAQLEDLAVAACETAGL